MSRPDEYRAEAAIREYLFEIFNLNFDEQPSFSMIPQGEDEWAFYILADDTTSFVRPDLSIEWHGTNWEPDSDDPAPLT